MTKRRQTIVRIDLELWEKKDREITSPMDPRWHSGDPLPRESVYQVPPFLHQQGPVENARLVDTHIHAGRWLILIYEWKEEEKKPPPWPGSRR